MDRIAVEPDQAVTADPVGTRQKHAAQLRIAGELPAYRSMLDREGVAGPAVTVIVGDEDEIARVLQRLLDAGATEIVAFVASHPNDTDRTIDALGSLTRVPRSPARQQSARTATSR